MSEKIVQTEYWTQHLWTTSRSGNCYTMEVGISGPTHDKIKSILVAKSSLITNICILPEWNRSSLRIWLVTTFSSLWFLVIVCLRIWWKHQKSGNWGSWKTKFTFRLEWIAIKKLKNMNKIINILVLRFDRTENALHNN